jgi:hypothetical protein
MKTTPLLLLGVLLFTAATSRTSGQTGPFSPDAWPTTVNPNKKAHYLVVGTPLAAPSANWLEEELVLAGGGDQVTQPITIGGREGVKVTGNYLNIGDKSFEEWADDEVIDILVQVYGDGAVLNASGQPRNFNLLTGTLPELKEENGGQIPVEGKNNKWNWVLFRIPNGTRASDGSRFIGSIPANAQGDTRYGGVNGGTIRFQTVPNLIVRVVAFGEEGAFGEPEAVNKFAPADACDPEPNTNLVGIDLNANQINHLTVIDNGDQTVTYQDTVGPTGDRRRAVRPNGSFLNFGITDNYLGKSCNDPRAVKVCVDFYDDPAFAGAEVRFGPEAYATDDQGGIAIFAADRRQTLAGTGQWIRRSWTVPAVSLKGVNAGTLTAGPRFVSENGQVFVSRIQMAVLRTGTHPLAGQDALADCYEDPAICTEAYGNYAELDLAKDIKNGLDVGSSGGDQEMIQEEAGPANDRRLAVRPARDDGTPGFTHNFLNFGIQNEALGPTSQPVARLAICVTYYDDPALAGATFRPEVYITEVNGSENFGFTPANTAVALEGTDQWRTAYWEINDIKFKGVNQGPQAAARFVLSDKIFVTAVKYGVIRPCGPRANVNPVASCAPVVDTQPSLAGRWTADRKLRLSWPVAAQGFKVQQTPTLTAPQWQDVATAPAVDGEQNVLTLTPTTTTFYRLIK